jgi:hypothetical protein
VWPWKGGVKEGKNDRFLSQCTADSHRRNSGQPEIAPESGILIVRNSPADLKSPGEYQKVIFIKITIQNQYNETYI